MSCCKHILVNSSRIDTVQGKAARDAFFHLFGYSRFSIESSMDFKERKEEIAQ